MTLLSANEITTFRLSFDEDLLACRAAGFGGIGLWLRKVLDFGEERAVELIEESGLSVTSLSWVGGFTGADAATASENVATAMRAIDLAAELSAGCVVVHPGGRNGHTRRHADRLIRLALDRLLPHAERMGAPLALEAMHPACADEWTLWTDLRTMLSLVREYETPALRCVLDSYHFPLGEGDLELMRELAPHLAVVHIGDFVEPRGVDQARTPLGEGDAPLGQFVGGLMAAGYQGPFDVKLIGPAVETADYDGLLRSSRSELSRLVTSPTAFNTPKPGATIATRPSDRRATLDPAPGDRVLFRA